MTPISDRFEDVADLPDVQVAVGFAPVGTPPADDSDVADLPDAESPLASSYKSIPVDNPDEAAKIIGLARQTGENENFVQNNLPEVQAAAAGPTHEQLSQIERDSPRSADWLANSKNMAVAHDDLPGLATGERILTGLSQFLSVASGAGRPELAEQVTIETGQGMVSGATNVRIAELGWKQALQAAATGIHNAALEPELADLELRAQAEAAKTPKGIAPAYYMGQQLPNLVLMARKGLERGIQGAAVFGAGAAIAGGIPAVPAAIAGATILGRMGTAEGIMVLEGGLAYREFTALRDRNGNPVNPGLAGKMAVVVSAFNAGLEYLSLAMLLRIPGAETLLGVFGKRTLKATPKEALKEAVKYWLMATGSELVTEGAQETVTAGGAEAIKALSGQPFEGAAPSLTWERVLSVVGPTLQATALMGVPGAVVTSMHHQAALRGTDALTERVGVAYQELGKEADKSKLMKRSPEAYQEYLESVTKDSPAENIYIPADAFTEFAQKNEIDPAALADQLGVGTLYQEALDTGGDIIIPTSLWVVKSKSIGQAVNVDVFNGLAEDVKFAPHDLTKRQTQVRKKQLESDLTTAADEAIKADETGVLESQRQTIYDQRYQELVDAGRPEKEAKDAADIYSRMVLRLSAQAEGLTPEQANVALIGKIKGVDELRAPAELPTAEKEIAAARRRLYSETKAEIDKRPEYQAAEDLRKRLGPGYRQLAIRALAKDVITPEQRQAFHDAAGTYGLGEAEDLIKLIAELPKREDALKQMLDVRMQGQYGQQMFQVSPAVNTPEFKAWFGDSKVVDGRGKPLVVYHGTHGDKAKKMSKIKGILWLTSDPDVAFHYAGFNKQAILPFYVNISNPVELHSGSEMKGILKEAGWDDVKIKEAEERIGWDSEYSWSWLDENKDVVNAIKSLGYDGAKVFDDYANVDSKSPLYKEHGSGTYTHQSWVAFSPTQIKSVFNRGTFDPNDPNIMFQLAQPKAALPLADIYEKISEGILALRSKTGEMTEKQSLKFHEDYKSMLDRFGKIYRMEKESKEFADWLRANVGAGMDKTILYQKMQDIFGQAAAGAFDPRTKNILLSLKHANASTMIHEMAHPWLKLVGELVESGRASDGLTADYSALQKWFASDFKSFETWTKKQDAKINAKREWESYGKFFQIYGQEKFAHAFEAYLRDGKAPSVELKSAFRRFRNWLVKIYRSVMDIGGGILGVEGISSEVRAVMDRMLASEDEIAYAEKRMDYTRDIDLSGVAPEVVAKLDELQVQAHEDAVAELTQIQMREITPENQAFLTRKRKELTEATTKAVKTQPEYVTIERLGKLFKGQTHRDISQKYLDGTMTEAERTAFDVAAEASGYYSGEEMAKRLIAMRPAAEEIQSRVSEAMRAAYPDYRTTEDIRVQAMELVHNSKQIEVLALEREILLEKLEKRTTGVAARAANRARAWQEAAAANTMAQEILSAKKVGELRSPLPFFTAERNAAVKVAEALAKKDFARAAEWKRKQMINHALGVSVMKLKKQIEKTVRQIGDIFSKRTELLKDQETADQVAYLLERFGFGQRKDYDPAQRKESLAAYLQRMEIFFKSDAQDTTPYQVPAWILTTDAPRPWPTLRIDELEDVKSAIFNITHVANMQDRFYTLSDKMTITMMSDSLAAEADLNLGSRRIAKQVEDWTDKLTAWVDSAVLTHEQALTVFQKLDGDKKDGPWVRALLNPVIEREQEESKRIDAAGKKIREILDVYKPRELVDMFKKKILVPEFGVDRNNPITKETLIGLLLNMGNAGNIDRLVSDHPEGFDKSPLDWSRQNAEQVLTTIKAVLVRHLDKRDFEMAQRIWDVIEEFWPEIVEHQKRMSGFVPKGVEAVPIEFVLRDGETIRLRGGYYPLKRDPRSGPRSAEIVAETELSRRESVARIPATSHGFTEARTGGKYAVRLTLDVAAQHLNEVLHDLYFRDIVVDLRRLVNNPAFFDGVKRNIGLRGYKFIKEWVAFIAGGTDGMNQASTLWNGIMRWTRQNAVSSIMAFSQRLSIQNLANVFLYGRAIQGWTYTDSVKAALKYGLANYIPKLLIRVTTLGAHKAALRMREFIWNKSQTMRDRARNPEPTLREAKKIFMKKDKLVERFASAFLAWSDDIWNTPQWIGAYYKKLGETQDEKAAIKFADDLIKSAITPVSKYELAPVLRDPNETVRLFTTFYGFWNAQLNRFIREVLPLAKQYGRPIKNAEEIIKHAPELLGAVASWVAFCAVSGLLVGDAPGKDAPEEDKEMWLAYELIRNGLSFFPFVREIGGVLVGRAMGMGYAGLGGFRPGIGLGAVNRSLENVWRIVKEFQGEGEGTVRAVLEPASQIASFIRPYPQIINTLIWNAIDWKEGMEFSPYDLMSRRPRRER